MFNEIMRVMGCFPNSALNAHRELVLSPMNYLYVCLGDCKSALDVKVKVIEALSRAAFKDEEFVDGEDVEARCEFVREGLNAYLGVIFLSADWELVYCQLGNGVNRELTKRFIESGCDLSVLRPRARFGGSFLGWYVAPKNLPTPAQNGDSAMCGSSIYVSCNGEWINTTYVFADYVKFRGVSVETNKFVYGFLSKRRNTEEEPSVLHYCIDYEDHGVMMSDIVIPSTVSQMVGKDVNGVEIYLGDFVRRFDDDKVYEVVRGEWGVALQRDGERIAGNFGDLVVVRTPV